MRERSVLAIIPNWNGTADTLECLASLAAQRLRSGRIDVVVIDNASAPSEVRALRDGIDALSSLLSVSLLCSETNIGVPAAYNRGIAAARVKYEYFLRLDNDVVLLPDAVETLCSALDGQYSSGVRLVGGDVRFFHDAEARNGGAVWIDLLRGRTGVTYPAVDVICDGVLGCVMLMDGGLVEAFAPEVFDSWLYLTTDESELSLRARGRGWSTYYVARPIALHKGGRSTSRVKTRTTLFCLRNWSFLATAYAPSALVRAAVVARIVGTALYKFTTGRGREAVWMIRGVLQGLAVARTVSPHSG